MRRLKNHVDNCTFISLLLLVLYTSQLTGQERKSLKFKAPELTEEDTLSRFLPDNFKCDACQAISHQMFKTFQNFNSLNKQYKFELPESELIELLEAACDKEVYSMYGVKTVNGLNRLNGPGVKASENTAGMIAGGGRWPGRLSEICGRYVEHLGEEEIYLAYKNNRKMKDNFYEYLCEGNIEVRSSCVSGGETKQEL